MDFPRHLFSPSNFLYTYLLTTFAKPYANSLLNETTMYSTAGIQTEIYLAGDNVNPFSKQWRRLVDQHCQNKHLKNTKLVWKVWRFVGRLVERARHDHAASAWSARACAGERRLHTLGWDREKTSGMGWDVLLFCDLVMLRCLRLLF